MFRAEKGYKIQLLLTFKRVVLGCQDLHVRAATATISGPHASLPHSKQRCQDGDILYTSCPGRALTLHQDVGVWVWLQGLLHGQVDIRVSKWIQK